MVKQINPGLARLWLADNTKQYGSNGQLKLANLSESQLRVLDYLEAGISDNQLHLLSKMAVTDEATSRDLLDRLGPLVSRTSSFLPDFTEADVSQHFSEIMRLFLLASEDPAATLKARRHKKIFISALDRTGLTLVKAFAASAIGLVFTEDHQPVTTGDTLPLGYSESFLGSQRVKAARAIETKIELQLHSRRSAAFDRADIAVLISTDVINPALYQTWMARDVPHISICYDESGVEISSLIIPGVTPCLSCIELGRIQNDKDRIAVATQLAQLDRNLADSSSVLFAAGITLTKTLNYLDRIEITATAGATRLTRDGEIIEQEPRWINCGCRSVE